MIGNFVDVSIVLISGEGISEEVVEKFVGFVLIMVDGKEENSIMLWFQSVSGLESFVFCNVEVEKVELVFVIMIQKLGIDLYVLVYCYFSIFI